MAQSQNIADAIKVLLSRDPELEQEVEEEDFNVNIASQIVEARESQGISQKKLAELAGTQQSVISRIEDADYSGHSTRLLRKIANALGKTIRFELFDKPRWSVTEELNVDWTNEQSWTPEIQTNATEIVNAGQ